MRKKIIYFTISLTFLLSISQLSYGQLLHNDGHKITVYNSSNDGYPWGFGDYLTNYNDTGLHMDDLAQALSDANIDIVYLSANATNSSVIVLDSWGQLAGRADNVFLYECGLRNIVVYKKLSDNEEHCLTENHDIVEDAFYDVLSWNAMMGANLFYWDGVWLDIEAHKLSEWDYTTTGNNIMGQYLNLIHKLDLMNTAVTWSADLPIIVYLEKELQRYYVDNHTAYPNYLYSKFIDEGAAAVAFMTYKHVNMYGKLGILEETSHPDPCYPDANGRYSLTYFQCASQLIYGEYINNTFVPSNGANMEFALRVWPEFPGISGNYYFSDENEMMSYRSSIASYFTSPTFYNFSTETFATYLQFLDITPGSSGSPIKGGNKSSTMTSWETNSDDAIIENNYIVYNITGHIVDSSYDLEKLKQNLPRGLYIIVNKAKPDEKPLKIKIN